MTRYPSLFQINTRVWLREIGTQLGRQATLDDIPNAALDEWRRLGFDWIWLLSVWQTGAIGQRFSRSNPDLAREFRDILPDFRDDDIPGSGFAISAYRVHDHLGGDDALARLRERMRSRGLKLMLDFVPNHTAIDHLWVAERPDYYVPGTEFDLVRTPHDYTRVQLPQGDRLLAHGRDPNFPGWRDTLQLDYSNPAAQEALVGELRRISKQCDGLRCDMAMLVLPQVFERTWGRRSRPFWPQAIQAVRDQVPGFTFLAEVYWDLGWELQQQGFDYAYDKRLYDRLRELHARPVREHLYAGLDYQSKLARFLENHDEPRAAAVFSRQVHQAAAVVTFLSPGLRFFHQGQLEGYRKRISPHLGRGPQEPVDASLVDFYGQLLGVLRNDALRAGHWQLLECTPAWNQNSTHDHIIAFAWSHADARRLIGTVNYSGHQSQCYCRLPFDELAHREWNLVDKLSADTFVRQGDELVDRGLFLDMRPWQAAVYELNSN